MVSQISHATHEWEAAMPREPSPKPTFLGESVEDAAAFLEESCEESCGML